MKNDLRQLKDECTYLAERAFTLGQPLIGRKLMDCAEYLRRWLVVMTEEEPS